MLRSVIFSFSEKNFRRKVTITVLKTGYVRCSLGGRAVKKVREC